jgi:hypothetical protein
VGAGGTLANLIFGALFWVVARAVRQSASGRYFFWLLMTFNLFEAGGYFLFSGIGDIGDWAAIVARWQPAWAWRVALIAPGTATYFFCGYLCAHGRLALPTKNPSGAQLSRSEQTAHAAPTAARNERRFPPIFRFMSRTFSTSFANYRSPARVGGLTTIALPTISINESPGIHSTAMHARDGALPEEK